MMFKWLCVLILLILNFDVSLAKTVCTVTINSSEEQEVFRNKLEPQGFDFVELLDYATDPQNKSSEWLDKACEAGIQCDVLLISGHFGGSFFGKSGFSLSLDRLEEASCNAKCDGILKKPKEVYLMGCNTLRGKESDFRTPEEYYRALVDHEVEPSVASQVVAAATSPLGFSNKERMQRSFENVPLIYGFSSVAPSGVNVKSTLINYLNSIPNYIQHLAQITNQNASPNKFTKFLSMFPIRSAQGLQTSDTQGLEIKKNMCELAYSSHSSTQKIDRVVSLFKENSFTYVFTLLNYFEQLSSYVMKNDHQFVQKLIDLGRDSDFVGKLTKIYQSNFDLSISFKTLEALKTIQAIDAKKSAQMALNLYEVELSKLTMNSADKICSEADRLVKIPNILDKTATIVAKMSHRQRLSPQILKSVDCLVNHNHFRKMKSQSIETINELLIQSFPYVYEHLSSIHSIYPLVRLLNADRSLPQNKMNILGQLKISKLQYSSELSFIRDTIILGFLPLKQQEGLFEKMSKIAMTHSNQKNLSYFYYFFEHIQTSDTVNVNYIKKMISEFSKRCQEDCYLEDGIVEKFNLTKWVFSLPNEQLKLNILTRRFLYTGVKSIRYEVDELQFLFNNYLNCTYVLNDYLTYKNESLWSRAEIKLLLDIVVADEKLNRLEQKTKNSIFYILLKHNNKYQLNVFNKLKIPDQFQISKIQVEENTTMYSWLKIERDQVHQHK